MAGVKRLTPEEREEIRKGKAEKLKQKGKAMIAKAKQLEAKDRKDERKQRVRELIEFSAFFSQFVDRKAMLEYIKNPTWGGRDDKGGLWTFKQKRDVGYSLKNKEGDVVTIKKVYPLFDRFIEEQNSL